MPYCVKCGSQYSEGATFCASCRTRIAPSASANAASVATPEATGVGAAVLAAQSARRPKWSRRASPSAVARPAVGLVILLLVPFSRVARAQTSHKAPLACTMRLSGKELAPASASSVSSAEQPSTPPKISVPPGFSVFISGACTSDNKHDMVKAQITGPFPSIGGLVTAQLRPIIGHPGIFDYQMGFGQTSQTGSYKAVLTGPDGIGKYYGSFTVKPWKIYGDEVANTMESIADTASQLADQVSQGLTNLPYSPPQQEALAKVKDLQTKLAEGPQHAQAFRKALEQVSDEAS